MGRALHTAAFPATVGGAMNEEVATRAVALVERLFALLHDCRALVPQLEAGTDPEPVSAQAERLLYYALVGAIEAGLVRTAEDALTVLRQASQPLGPLPSRAVDPARARRPSRLPRDPEVGPTRRTPKLLLGHLVDGEDWLA